MKPIFSLVRTHGLACGTQFFAGENRLFLLVNLACPLVANLQLGFHWDLLNARRLSTLNLLEKDWSLKMCLVKSCSPWLRLAIFWCQSLLGQVVHRDEISWLLMLRGVISTHNSWWGREVRSLWFPSNSRSKISTQMQIQPQKKQGLGTVGNTRN